MHLHKGESMRENRRRFPKTTFSNIGQLARAHKSTAIAARAYHPKFGRNHIGYSALRPIEKVLTSSPSYSSRIGGVGRYDHPMCRLYDRAARHTKKLNGRFACLLFHSIFTSVVMQTLRINSGSFVERCTCSVPVHINFSHRGFVHTTVHWRVPASTAPKNDRLLYTDSETRIWPILSKNRPRPVSASRR